MISDNNVSFVYDKQNQVQGRIMIIYQDGSIALSHSYDY